jgi:hypothetical protein
MFHNKQMNIFHMKNWLGIYMKQLNNEQWTIVHDIMYFFKKKVTKPFHVLLTFGVSTKRKVHCIFYKTWYHFT